MDEVVEISDRGHVRTITLNRPERLNALSGDMGWGIYNAVREAYRDDDVWVIAITGSGRGFCAGADLVGGTPPAESPLTPMETYLSDDGGWVSQIPLLFRTECEKPIVAAVNGVAAGGGVGLAMACDVRIMSDAASFVAAYPKIVACPDVGLSWTMPRLIGYEKAFRFFLENRRVGAQEALDLGMVSEVVPHDQLLQRTAEYCESLCQWSPIATRIAKRVLIKAEADIDLQAQFRFEVATVTRGLGSEDGREARKAFQEKRTPTYRGR